uniref:Uncharacterized protein n=1 Tax=Nelumbo nucifera TaxID=4432 RepID=A0A822XTP3_NELNU|nr:TPA_asm: hypothetical protein HUJ06_024556 [Nelumbo nucifera]
MRKNGNFEEEEDTVGSVLPGRRCFAWGELTEDDGDASAAFGYNKEWGDATAFGSNDEEGGEQEDDRNAAGVFGSSEEEDYRWKMAAAVFGSNEEDFRWDIRGIMGSKVSLI